MGRDPGREEIAETWSGDDFSLDQMCFPYWLQPSAHRNLSCFIDSSPTQRISQSIWCINFRLCIYLMIYVILFRKMSQHPHRTGHREIPRFAGLPVSSLCCFLLYCLSSSPKSYLMSSTASVNTINDSGGMELAFEPGDLVGFLFLFLSLLCPSPSFLFFF